MPVPPDCTLKVPFRTEHNYLIRRRYRRKHPSQDGRCNRHSAQERITNSQGKAQPRTFQHGIVGECQNAEPQKRCGEGKKNGEAYKPQRRIIFIEIALIGTHQIKSIVRSHPDDYDRHHEGRYSEGLPCEI